MAKAKQKAPDELYDNLDTKKKGIHINCETEGSSWEGFGDTDR